MISQEAIERVLGINEKTDLSREDMAKTIVFTFFPYDPHKCSDNIIKFSDLLQSTFKELNIQVVPYPDSLEKVPLGKVFKRFIKIAVNNFLFFLLQNIGKEHGYYYIHPGAFLNLFKRYRVRKGVTIIALGKNDTSRLPIDYTSSFSKNSIITILDCPPNIDQNTNFATHFDTAMNFFSYHMTQIVILVTDEKWVLYNFNASHPIYPIDGSFKKNILHALIPKVAAPMKPPLFNEFAIESESFDIDSDYYSKHVRDFIEGGKLFNQTNLYPAGKKVDTLPFRTGFYRWIGAIHLDHRSGMSYGFLARQLPVTLEPLVPYVEQAESVGRNPTKDYLIKDNNLHLIIELASGRYLIRVPPVWVLTLRSGSDKTNVDPHRDILLLGLENGKMYLRTSKDMKLRKDYRASFDTKVILAHAVGNALIASVLDYLKNTQPGIDTSFSRELSTNGAAILHWHGYMRSAIIPDGWHAYGHTNPHVACSTAQSAVYALAGKLVSFNKAIEEKKIYRGDIHIEPHHGTNVTFTSISDFAKFLINTPNASELGNKYLIES